MAQTLTPTPRLLYTPTEAAVVLSLGRSTVYNLMATGTLPYVKQGRARRIRWTELERYASSLEPMTG
ncbi:helix-turn-helix domain-containing protein [Streptomyces sp. NPDC093085]|uniref:helix-turn-helix domain-containing protein n=1 Tax=Streptomyces sp. NPDC093085 TaxID=3155068 RepID=UPI003413C3C6